MSPLLNVNPSVHVQYVRLCRCAVTPRRRRRVYCVNTSVCVRVCVSVHHSHHVQPCSCVSRVDVPKWGHFLSVWCLRNNPTAQKLLQPSASTYSSLYCTEVAMPFLFDYRLIHAVWFCMTRHYHSSCVMPALLLTIWGFGFISKRQSTSLTSNCGKSKSYCKISDLGSNVCDLICLSLFVFTNVHARLDACLRVWGPFNLSPIRRIFYLKSGLHGWCSLITACLWIQLLPQYILLIFSSVTFSRAQSKDVIKLDVPSWICVYIFLKLEDFRQNAVTDITEHTPWVCLLQIDPSKNVKKGGKKWGTPPSFIWARHLKECDLLKVCRFSFFTLTSLMIVARRWPLMTGVCVSVPYVCGALFVTA